MMWCAAGACCATVSRSMGWLLCAKVCMFVRASVCICLYVWKRRRGGTQVCSDVVVVTAGCAPFRVVS